MWVGSFQKAWFQFSEVWTQLLSPVFSLPDINKHIDLNHRLKLEMAESLYTVRLYIPDATLYHSVI